MSDSGILVRTMIRARVLPLAASLVLVLVAGSLASAQSKTAKKSVESLDSVIRETAKGRDQVHAALQSLDALGSGGSLTKSYAKFTRNVAAMAKTKDRVVYRVDDMNARRDAYLDEWHKKAKSVNSPEIQAHMEVRREEVKRVLDSSRSAREAARDAFLPFLTNLQDIDKLLSVDLSPTGVQAAAPITESAVRNGNAVLAGLDSLLASLTRVRDQISPKK